MQQRKLCVSSPVIKMSGPNLFLSRAIALIPIFTIPFSHLKTETLHFLVTLLRPYFSILNPNSPFFSSTILHLTPPLKIVTLIFSSHPPPWLHPISLSLKFKLHPLPCFFYHLPPPHSPVSKPQPQFFFITFLHLTLWSQNSNLQIFFHLPPTHFPISRPTIVF